MVLSVIIYDHTLTLGQWFGAAIVFAGISVEAWVKRKGTFRGQHVVYNANSTPQMFMQSV
jgi:drug/metabolite transporter (DMT)-like permease